LRLPRPRTASLALPLVVTVLVAACSSGGDESASSASRETTTTTAAGAKVTVGEVHVQSAGPDVKLDPATGHALLDSTKKYVDAAVVAPLRDGKLGAAYAELFDGNVKAPANAADREALTDVSVGKATDGYKVTVAPVRIDAVADQSGKLLFAAATIQATSDTTTAAGPLKIARATELTFSPAFGSWKVTAYRAVASRQAAAGTTTTTAEAGGATTTTKEKG
jgi:hypothetical protein